MSPIPSFKRWRQEDQKTCLGYTKHYLIRKKDRERVWGRERGRERGRKKERKEKGGEGKEEGNHSEEEAEVGSQPRQPMFFIMFSTVASFIATG